MTIPSINGVNATNTPYANPYLYNNPVSTMPNPLYNDSIWDMETSMASGYNPMYDTAMMGYGYNMPGYMSPYGYDMYGYGGYGLYGMSPAYAQAMVQSQGIYMDGMAALNRKQRAINYNGQIDTMNYDVRLNDAVDTHKEDKTRRDTNINDVFRKMNERLEAQDTQGFYEAYNYGLALYAKVYADVNNKRLDETPSNRTAIKSGFHQKYAEFNGGKTLHQKIDESLPGAFGSGFDSVWRMQDVTSAEEMKSLVDDRPVAYKKQEETYKTFGKITGGVANTALWGAGGTATGAAAGAGIGALFKKAGKGGKFGALIGGAAGLITGAGRSLY